MAQNRCKWLYKKGNEMCSRRCIGDFCAAHNQQVKNGSTMMITCIKCGQVVRGKTKLCAECGGKRYRSFVKYYKQRYNIIYDENDFLTGNYREKQLNK